MLYNIGDLFMVDGVEFKVSYINNGKAWLTPLNDDDMFNGEHTRRGVAVAILDPKGRELKTGKKAFTVKRPDSSHAV